MGALVGAATAFGIGKTAEHVEFVRSNWYAPPLLLIGLGHWLKRKNVNLGASMIGAGGAIGYYGYAFSRQGAKGADAMPVDYGDAGDGYDGNAGAFAYDAYGDNRALSGTVTGIVSPDASDFDVTAAEGLQG
ncbi:MAG: hypothetical protein ACREN5_11235 [Gemmatimonadales bacterium]